MTNRKNPPLTLRLSEQASQQLQRKSFPDRKAERQSRREEKDRELVAAQKARATVVEEARVAEENLKAVLAEYEAGTEVDLRRRLRDAEIRVVNTGTRVRQLWNKLEEAQADLIDAEVERDRLKVRLAQEFALFERLKDAWEVFCSTWGMINPTKRRRKLWDNDLRKKVRGIVHET